MEVLSRAFLLTEKPRGRLHNTFDQRTTELRPLDAPFAFAPEFHDDADKVRQWTAFSHKSRTYVEPVEFKRREHGEFLNWAKIRVFFRVLIPCPGYAMSSSFSFI